MNTSEVLDRAADLIEERGWEKGSGWPGTEEASHGRLCVEGGIMAALGLSYDRIGVLWGCPAYEAVKEYLTGPENPGAKSLFMWNDHLVYEQDERGEVLLRYVGGTETSGREYAQQRVIATLRACAVIEAAKEDEAANQSPAATPDVEPAL